LQRGSTSSTCVLQPTLERSCTFLLKCCFATLLCPALLLACCSHTLLSLIPALLLQSVYGIARTMFLACLLAAGAMLIHQDTFRLVLQPVQRMVERVREMAEDPLLQAAVRTSPAAAAASSSSGATDSAANSSSGGTAALMSKEQQQAAAAAGGGEGSGWSAKSSPQQSSRPSRMSRIRFWPSVQVHAVAEDAAEGKPGCQGPSSTDGGKAAARRGSGAQMLLAGTRRLSLGVVAGVSAAGAVAVRLGQQLKARTSAMRALVLGGRGDSEEEAAQGQYETRLLEQSIYKICALLAVGFGDAGAEVIAENIKKEGDLNPIVPGKKMVSSWGLRQPGHRPINDAAGAMLLVLERKTALLVTFALCKLQTN
jgi:hypothetical protein